MFHIKELPPVERRANGSLYRMDAKQRREAVRLIRERCSYYDSGNCLYLDRGEEVACPQSISYSVCCKFFRHVLLKDEAGRGLEAEVFRQAAGRLIRSETDRGVVAIIDKRVSSPKERVHHTASMGISTLGSVVTNSMSDIEEFFNEDIRI